MCVCCLLLEDPGIGDQEREVGVSDRGVKEGPQVDRRVPERRG